MIQGILGRSQIDREKRGARGALFALFVALSFVAVPAAGASTVAVIGAVPGAASQIRYTGTVGEINDLTVTFASGVYTFTDPGVISIVPTAPCTTVTATSVTCPNPDPGSNDAPNSLTVPEVGVVLGDQSDKANVSLEGATTDALIDGGPGNDQLTGVNGRYVIRGNAGSDLLVGGPNRDFLYAVTEANFDNGGGGDILRAGDGNDRIIGGSGDDLFDMGSAPDGSDFIDQGGAGDDTLSYAKRTASVQVNMDLTNPAGQGGGIGGDIASGADEVQTVTVNGSPTGGP